MEKPTIMKTAATNTVSTIMAGRLREVRPRVPVPADRPLSDGASALA